MKTTDGKADAHMGSSAARLRRREEIPRIVSLSGGGLAERRLVVLELPLEPSTDGRAGYMSSSKAELQPRLPCSGRSTDQTANDWAHQVTTSAIDDAARDVGRPARPHGLRAHLTAAIRSTSSPDATRGSASRLSLACGIFDFNSMYGETEVFFVNNDYGGPYWDTKNATAQRSCQLAA